VLRPDHAEDPAALRDLVREGDVLDRIAHPVVVRSFGADAGGPFPHLLLEHLEGPTLQELLDRHGPVGLEQLLPLGMHVASALHYLSREDVVHLDVKPDNLVMGAPPRLIDFSVSRGLAAAGRLTKPVGTDAYMAPEQCDRARGPLGPPADVYGLGTTMYRAMTGERPFRRPDAPPAGRRGAPGRSEDPAVRFPQLAGEPAPLPRRTPAPLAELLRAMLAPEPADRPTAAQVVAALEPVVAELPRRLVLGRRGLRARR
jgi:serine/threonine protein kinase